mgnify:CR=1 FL=1
MSTLYKMLIVLRFMQIQKSIKSYLKKMSLKKIFKVKKDWALRTNIGRYDFIS